MTVVVDYEPVLTSEGDPDPDATCRLASTESFTQVRDVLIGSDELALRTLWLNRTRMVVPVYDDVKFDKPFRVLEAMIESGTINGHIRFPSVLFHLLPPEVMVITPSKMDGLLALNADKAAKLAGDSE